MKNLLIALIVFVAFTGTVEARRFTVEARVPSGVCVEADGSTGVRFHGSPSAESYVSYFARWVYGEVERQLRPIRRLQYGHEDFVGICS